MKISFPNKGQNRMLTNALTFANIWAFVAGVLLLVGFWVTVWRFRKDLEAQIKELIKRKDFLDGLSQLVKPDLIFDETQSIIADRGGVALIKGGGIVVKIGEPFQSRKMPVEIQIDFLKHLATAPLLTPLNPDVVTITTKRGKGFAWIYSIDYQMAGGHPDDYLRRYRLEIF